MENPFFYLALGLLLLSHTTFCLLDYTTDQNALLSFKKSINSDPRNILSQNWSTNSSVCNWIGVSCSIKHRRITALNLSRFELGGTVTPDLSNLTFLRYLDISSNKFSGRIPSDLSNLRRLKSINIAANSFVGEIPPWLAVLPELELLNMRSNNFSGEIPSSFFNGSTLQILDMSLNQLNGRIPEEIGSMSKLRRLYLRANEFEGQIPKQIGNLSSLEYLVLDTNNFTGELPGEIGNLAMLQAFTVRTNLLHGPIPSSIFNLSTLRILELSQNNLSGNLPPTMGLTLPNLQNLYLHTNTFTGPIPASIANASNLAVLDISMNSFTGFIPNLSNLQGLQQLSIVVNNLTSPKSPSEELLFLTWLTNCRSLRALDISYNPLDGVIPSSIGNFSDSLQLFWARNCNMSGAVPPELGNLTGLLVMYWSENHFSGFIPNELTKMRQLQVLSFRGSSLQGSIPRGLCGMSGLGELSFRNNMLTGSIPDCLGELRSLRELSIGGNKLNSTIPSSLWSLTDLVYLDLSSNDLRGNLSSGIGGLKVLSQLNLSFNQFSGDIPSLIDGCQVLESLSLSNNMFEGSIPQSLGNIRGLIVLDLSSNNLSGSIPRTLEDLLFLRRFNVSHNSLQGEIPNLNFSAESFAHNSNLCGAEEIGVPPCIERSRSRSRSKLVKYIVPPIASAFILVIVMFILLRKRKSKQLLTSSDDDLPGVSWRRVSYRELQIGTDNFSENSLLGRGSYGSVFKGRLSDESTVAVKVFNLELEGALKSFETEGEILSRVRHRNLVRIIGCCSNIEFKALILGYMPNGSLERWLYSPHNRLDFERSLNVAVDVGLALEYLHHGHTFPIIHCDIKPSNVLVDEDMTARLSDFGVSKLFDEGEAVAQTKTLATVGYAAPEYGSEGKVSIKNDVYSYGIMLLEIFTRKKPTDEMFSGEMELKEWVRIAMEENRASEVVEPSLLSREDPDLHSKEQSLLFIFELAMKCLCVLPEDRINAMEIVSALHKIKAEFLANVQG